MLNYIYMGKRTLLLVAVLIFCAAGCAKRTAVTLPDGFTVHARVADTPQKIEKGLMFVKKLAPADGMLFFMEQDEMQAFWMKNTLIDLDIIFIAPDKTVRQVHEQVPHSYTYTPESDIAVVYGQGQYVLELPSGASAKHGIKTGSKLHFSTDTK